MFKKREENDTYLTHVAEIAVDADESDSAG